MNIAAITVSAVIAIFGFAGGGGSSSGGGGGGGSYSSYSSSSSSSGGSGESDPAFTFITIAIFIIVGAYVSSKSYKEYKFTHKDHNSTAEEKFIHSLAVEIFENYQADWTNFNYKNMKKYTTEQYYPHASLQLDLLREMHRVNKVSKIKIEKVYLLDPIDQSTSLPAKLRIRYVFDGLDEVYDTKTGNRLYHDNAVSASEIWNFIYDGKTLKLAGISQPTESAPHLVKSLANFASANHLYCSPDWGRYALPSRGLIFGGASMKVADINNHVIGKWGDLLIQLYTYANTPDQATSSYYVVGQINVPKEYLGVIVKSKKFRAKPDKSYEKFEMEWNEFNKRYDVYAASRDALPAFELLNPTFMEFLYSKNPNYNLEVVDNVIYIYAKVTSVKEQDYQDLLAVLEKAYAELKM